MRTAGSWSSASPDRLPIKRAPVPEFFHWCCRRISCIASRYRWYRWLGRGETFPSRIMPIRSPLEKRIISAMALPPFRLQYR